MSEQLTESSLISDSKLKTLWKQAVTASLSPDNDYPAYKIYYILLRKDIIEKYCKNNDDLKKNSDKDN
jgi:hypothetical protein